MGIFSRGIRIKPDALDAIKGGFGSLVWLGDGRIAAVASSSIDRSTVDLNRGEMLFSMFDFHPRIDGIANANGSSRAKIERLLAITGEGAFPEYVRRYILANLPCRIIFLGLQYRERL